MMHFMGAESWEGWSRIHRSPVNRWSASRGASTGLKWNSWQFNTAKWSNTQVQLSFSGKVNRTRSGWLNRVVQSRVAFQARFVREWIALLNGVLNRQLWTRLISIRPGTSVLVWIALGSWYLCVYCAVLVIDALNRNKGYQIRPWIINNSPLNKDGEALSSTDSRVRITRSNAIDLITSLALSPLFRAVITFGADYWSRQLGSQNIQTLMRAPS